MKKESGSAKDKQRRLQAGDHVRVVAIGKFRYKTGVILSINGHNRADVKIEGVRKSPRFFLNQLQRT